MGSKVGSSLWLTPCLLTCFYLDSKGQSPYTPSPNKRSMHSRFVLVEVFFESPGDLAKLKDGIENGEEDVGDYTEGFA